MFLQERTAPPHTLTSMFRPFYTRKKENQSRWSVGRRELFYWLLPALCRLLLGHECAVLRPAVEQALSISRAASQHSGQLEDLNQQFNITSLLKMGSEGVLSLYLFLLSVLCFSACSTSFFST